MFSLHNKSVFLYKIHFEETQKSYTNNYLSYSATNSRFTALNCIGDETLSTSSAYSLLGVPPNCSPSDLKAAFRTKVKQFHPDVRRDGEDSDLMIRRVIQAYEILSQCRKSEIIESECLDPFDTPECEAFDLFVNETLCAGKGCPSSCVMRAPNAFKYDSTSGTARASSQGHLNFRPPGVLLHQDMKKTTKFSLLLASAHEIVFIMLHLHRESFWRSYLTAY
ncbi:hypothetical protein ACET3Z_025982 [Daucus carota]